MSYAPHNLPQLINESHEDFYAATNAVAKEIGWPALMTFAYELLENPASKTSWPTAIEIITVGSAQKKALPKDLYEFIARIYFCADQCSEMESVEIDEQIWAFVSTWLGLPYTSDWSPYNDPEVSNRMARMQRENH